MGLGATLSLSASPGKKPLYLARRYTPGARMVYQTKITARIKLQSNPRGLQGYLPDVPSVITLRPENTLVIEAVRPDKSAEIKDRFDNFKLITTVTSDPPGHNHRAVQKVENAFTRQMTGQALIARYGPGGKLLSFTGAGPLLDRLQAPSRDLAHWGLELLLSQAGGYGFYPNQPVHIGEMWKRQGSTLLGKAFPFVENHDDTYRLVSRMRYRGVSVGVIEFDLANSMSAARNSGPSPGFFALLKNEGVTLGIGASGSGHGRAIVALDDGRILREHSIFHESFRGSVQGLPGVPLPATGPASLDIETDNAIDMIELTSGASTPRSQAFAAKGRRARESAAPAAGNSLGPRDRTAGNALQAEFRKK
ncbi:MAG: hypothetical protein ACRD10_08100 [Terriglobia bacterium]